MMRRDIYPPFIWQTIPAGSFKMGTVPENDKVASSSEWSGWSELTEQPQHMVYLPTFRISRYPVTKSQWSCFLEQSGYQWGEYERFVKDEVLLDKPNHPVVWVTWYDSKAFCNWAGVRLPTDAEWEKSARGDDSRLYPWGNQPPSPRLANYDNHVGKATAVDAYPEGVSPYGLFDMAGNTWEWLNTLWGEDKDQPRYRHPYHLDDGREEDGDETVLRVVRGGGWRYSADLIRAAYRDWNKPMTRGSALGFRVVSLMEVE
jgi:formylglycine-generating enzyme required for sulfatase activity